MLNLPKIKNHRTGFIDIISAIVVAVLLVGTATTTYLAQHGQDIRNYARNCGPDNIYCGGLPEDNSPPADSNPPPPDTQAPEPQPTSEPQPTQRTSYVPCARCPYGCDIYGECKEAPPSEQLPPPTQIPSQPTNEPQPTKAPAIQNCINLCVNNSGGTPEECKAGCSSNNTRPTTPPANEIIIPPTASPSFSGSNSCKVCLMNDTYNNCLPECGGGLPPTTPTSPPKVTPVVMAQSTPEPDSEAKRYAWRVVVPTDIAQREKEAKLTEAPQPNAKITPVVIADFYPTSAPQPTSAPVQIAFAQPTVAPMAATLNIGPSPKPIIGATTQEGITVSSDTTGIQAAHDAMQAWCNTNPKECQQRMEQNDRELLAVGVSVPIIAGAALTSPVWGPAAIAAAPAVGSAIAAGAPTAFTVGNYGASALLATGLVGAYGGAIYDANIGSLAQSPYYSAYQLSQRLGNLGADYANLAPIGFGLTRGIVDTFGIGNRTTQPLNTPLTQPAADEVPNGPLNWARTSTRIGFYFQNPQGDMTATIAKITDETQALTQKEGIGYAQSLARVVANYVGEGAQSPTYTLKGTVPEQFAINSQGQTCLTPNCLQVARVISAVSNNLGMPSSVLYYSELGTADPHFAAMIEKPSGPAVITYGNPNPWTDFSALGSLLRKENLIPLEGNWPQPVINGWMKTK